MVTPCKCYLKSSLKVNLSRHCSLFLLLIQTNNLFQLNNILRSDLTVVLVSPKGHWYLNFCFLCTPCSLQDMQTLALTSEGTELATEH